MNSRNEVVWAVQIIENGERKIVLDHLRHSTPEEAKDAAAAHLGIPWKELERRGATLIQRDKTLLHEDDPTGE